MKKGKHARAGEMSAHDKEIAKLTFNLICGIFAHATPEMVGVVMALLMNHYLNYFEGKDADGNDISKRVFDLWIEGVRKVQEKKPSPGV